MPSEPPPSVINHERFAGDEPGQIDGDEAFDVAQGFLRLSDLYFQLEGSLFLVDDARLPGRRDLLVLVAT